MQDRVVTFGIVCGSNKCRIARTTNTSGTARPRHFFFFNDTATTEIYTLSLHDALPISYASVFVLRKREPQMPRPYRAWGSRLDRKSTRLNSSHSQISYAVFCLKKKTIYLLTHRGHHHPSDHLAYSFLCSIHTSVAQRIA